MDEPKYLIMNPLQIELPDKIIKKIIKKINNERKLTEIEERFYNKMEKLKNINLQTKQLKYILHHHGLILIDI
jgi:hypothetical protein